MAIRVDISAIERIRRNRTAGIAATLSRASRSAPGASELIKQSLNNKYEENRD